MKDRFENFIEENREHLDFHEPDPAIWDKLEKNIRAKHRFNWKLILSRAAVVAVIFAASYAANEMIHRMGTGGTKALNAAKENAIPGLTEAEAYYTGLLKQKMDELKPVMANCPSLEEELNYDLSELDSVYADLKRDLKDNMANQEVIEAIIENYRLKINILEDILSEITPTDDECIPKSDGYAL